MENRMDGDFDALILGARRLKLYVTIPLQIRFSIPWYGVSSPRAASTVCCTLYTVQHAGPCGRIAVAERTCAGPEKNEPLGITRPLTALYWVALRYNLVGVWGSSRRYRNEPCHDSLSHVGNYFEASAVARK